MAQETRIGQRTIEEAVRDGLLVDVTEIAKRAGMRYQTFMSPSLIARYNAKGPNELYAILEVYESYIKFLNGYDSYGAARYDDETYVLEPNDKYGHVILLLETDKLDGLNLKRTSGNELEYLM